MMYLLFYFEMFKVCDSKQTITNDDENRNKKYYDVISSRYSFRISLGNSANDKVNIKGKLYYDEGQVKQILHKYHGQSERYDDDINRVPMVIKKDTVDKSTQTEDFYEIPKRMKKYKIELNDTSNYNTDHSNSEPTYYSSIVNWTYKPSQEDYQIKNDFKAPKILERIINLEDLLFDNQDCSTEYNSEDEHVSNNCDMWQETTSSFEDFYECENSNSFVENSNENALEDSSSSISSFERNEERFSYDDEMVSTNSGLCEINGKEYNVKRTKDNFNSVYETSSIDISDDSSDTLVDKDSIEEIFEKNHNKTDDLEKIDAFSCSIIEKEKLDSDNAQGSEFHDTSSIDNSENNNFNDRHNSLKNPYDYKFQIIFDLSNPKSTLRLSFKKTEPFLKDSQFAKSWNIQLTKYYLFNRNDRFFIEIRKLITELLLFVIDLQIYTTKKHDYMGKSSLSRLFSLLMELFNILITENNIDKYFIDGTFDNEDNKEPFEILTSILKPKECPDVKNSCLVAFIADLNNNSLKYETLKSGFKSFSLALKLNDKEMKYNARDYMIAILLKDFIRKTR